MNVSEKTKPNNFPVAIDVTVWHYFSVSLLAFSFRVLFFDLTNFDIETCFKIWYETFLAVGRDDAFKTLFFNYTPATLYLYDLMTLWEKLPPIYGIKLISCFFDFFAAFGVMQIVKLKNKNGILPFLSYASSLFLPTVFVNSAVWGQSDGIYTSFLIWSLYFLLKQKKWLGILGFAVAICFKLQAIFFAPLLLVLIIHKKIAIHQLLLIPVVFFTSVVPAWLLGSPLDKLLLAYFTQFSHITELSKNAPNLYSFFPGNYPGYETVVWLGGGISLIFVFLYLFLRWGKWKGISKEMIIFDVSIFTLIIPFLLPKMHDRYFYSGCLFLLILGFYFPRTFHLVILSQLSSILAYAVFLTKMPSFFAQIGALFTTISIFLLLKALKFQLDFRKDIDSGIA